MTAARAVNRLQRTIVILPMAVFTQTNPPWNGSAETWHATDQRRFHVFPFLNVFTQRES